MDQSDFLQTLKLEPVWVVASSRWGSAVEIGDWFYVVQDAGNRWFWASPKDREEYGFIPHQSVFTWQADDAFRPEPTWDSAAASSFLTLEVGEHVIVESEYQDAWKGWAYGYSLEQPKQHGSFALKGLKAIVQCWCT